MSLRTVFWSIALLLSGTSCRYLCLITVAATTLPGNETDRLALMAFKVEITGDPFRVMSSWNDSLHFCQWMGVTCSLRHRRVTSLILPSLGLMGFISPYVGNLSFLKELMLLNNSLHGQIPPQLGRLFRLRVLRLGENSLTGRIPANLSRCSNLFHLRLGHNKLIGNIPIELGHLSKLELLVLGDNNLTGEIPPSLTNISSLQEIFLYGSNLEGRIPDEIGRLKSLKMLQISENHLSGMAPPSMYNLTSLTFLSLTQNHLHGSLPQDIGLTLPNLRVLYIDKNQFSGAVPLSLSNASSLKVIFIADNNFTGKVSVNFGGLQNLRVLSMANNRLGTGGPDDLNFINSLSNCTKFTRLGITGNHFGGPFPISITNLTQLDMLAMGGNQIFGSIPDGIGNLLNLNTLGMETNQLRGSIPSSIGKLQKLEILALTLNKLSGEIPSSLGNLTKISILDLSLNNLQGSVPTSLGNCRFLNGLNLSTNNLSGNIPREVLSLPALSIYLNLSKNYFNGSLPVEVGNLKNLMSLDLAENHMSGKIPSSIGSCIVLQDLHMQGNMFQGPIPSTLISLKGIQELDLSHNNLSGQIPRFLKNMSLLNLDLSYNNLEGEVPVEGVFGNVSAVSVAGNSRLCGGISELQLPLCFTGKARKQRTSRAFKLVIPIFFGLVGLTLLSSFLILFWLRKKIKQPSSPDSSLLSLLNLSYGSLLKGTDGFSSNNLIGVGSFGTVYKAVLDQAGTSVAVKVLNLQHQKASKSFMVECEALRNIRHRNLVKILTACSSVDFQGNDFKALVYEFMPNKSLDRWLHPIPEIEEAQKLKLVQRLSIAVDVACALEYLHHQCQTPIVHCDLKPSNVLLDNNMTAHVGDFGLAQFLQQTTDTVHPNQSSSIGVKGSIGYIAPEYGMGSDVSTKGDVYSYGILILEMFTGKRPTDDMFRDGLNLHTFVKMALPDRMSEVVDPMLLNSDEEATVASETTESLQRKRRESVQECLVSILALGLACCVESPMERMDMTCVTNELQAIKKFLQN